MSINKSPNAKSVFGSKKTTLPLPEEYGLKVLSGLEHIRLRPGMYTGADKSSHYHLFKEGIDNSIDELSNGRGSGLLILFQKNTNKIVIIDNGRGIPYEMHKDAKTNTSISKLVSAMTSLASSGKFTKFSEDNKFENNGYMYSAGLNGIGLKCISALSTKVRIDSVRGNKYFRVELTNGNEIPTYVTSSDKELDDIDIDNNLSHRLLKTHDVFKNYDTEDASSGTIIEFTPDFNLFSENKFEKNELIKILKYKKICISFPIYFIEIDNNDNIIKEHNIVGGGSLIESYDQFIDNNIPEDMLLVERSKSLLITKTKDTELMHWKVPNASITEYTIKLNWYTDSAVEDKFNEDSILKNHMHYVNTLYMVDPKKHVPVISILKLILEGVKELLSARNSLSTIRKVIEDAKWYDLEKNVIAYSDYRSTETPFLDQPKSALDGSVFIPDMFKHYMYSDILVWLESDKQIFDSIVSKLTAIVNARKNNKERIATNLKPKDNLPDNLSDRRQRTGGNLFIVEGDSAGSGAVAARDQVVDAILPLSGKPNNMAKRNSNSPLPTMVSNILNTIGTGTGKHYNSKKCRYDRIIILPDADPDGEHIANLIITMIYVLTPELLREGKVYLTHPPLFKNLMSNNTKIYTYSQSDQDEFIRRNEVEGGITIKNITRFKGLGEMTHKDLKETVFGPDKYSLLTQLLITDEIEDEFDSLINLLFGKDTVGRRDLLDMKTYQSEIIESLSEELSKDWRDYL